MGGKRAVANRAADLLALALRMRHADLTSLMHQGRLNFESDRLWYFDIRKHGA